MDPVADKEKEGEGKENKEQEEKITLSKEQYSALLDRLSELEGSTEKKDVYTLDELAKEGKERSRPLKEAQEEEDIDWDNATPKDVYNKLVTEVNKVGIQIKTDIETLKVMREIDKCEAKFEDFWKFEPAIRKIAMENPSLSIEKAYKLAKVDAGEEVNKKKEGEKDKDELKEVAKTKTEKLLNLPPRVPTGEKPGVVPSSTKSSEKMTLRESALKAWDETVGRDKTSI